MEMPPNAILAYCPLTFLVMSVCRHERASIYRGEPWTIPPNASRSFEGAEGEMFRKLMLSLAAGLQTHPRPPGRGCFHSQIKSEKKMRKACSGAEGPVVVWLKPETRLLERVPQARVPEAPVDDSMTRLKHAMSKYDTENTFLLWVQAPNNGSLVTVPLHDSVHSDDKPPQPVRFTIDTESIVTEVVFRVCAWCSNRSGNLARCQRCRCVRYCDNVCQKAHWPEHKKTCNKV